MSKLLEVLINSLLDNRSSLVAPQILYLHLVQCLSIVVCEHCQIWLYSCCKLLNTFFTIYLQTLVIIVSFEL